MPSFSPLSTFRPWRMREGIRGSETTACPSAASVGARTIASNTASMNASRPKTATPARAPATIVSGSPMASRRRGTTYWRRSARRSIREASEKSTTVSVASATQRTDSLRIVGSSQPRTSVLATMPPATNTIAGVITDPRSLREAAAYASTRSAIATRPEPPNPHTPPWRRSCLRVMRVERCNESRYGPSTCRAPRLGARPAGSASSSSARTGVSRP
jgi:hypothetical protein